MAITSTGFQAPATSRQGLKPSVYDKIILIGADVDPRLAGQGIFYALEKDIAAQAYTPEIYAARLKQRGFSDESAQAFTQAYIQKDINIAKDWANGKAVEVYENNVRTQVASEIKAKNEIEGEGWTMKDGGAAKTDYTIKTDLAPNVRDLSKITVDEITADLEYLAAKHPEIFDKPSDVFRLIREIKNDPTHFFTNNRLDYALIVKRLEDNKIGKLAVDKQSGEVKHATKVNSKDLKRLAKVSKEKSENAGIIQTFIQPGSKSQGELGLPTKRIISQNAAKDELKSLSKEYDVEQFLKDRENILAKDARYGKTRFSDARVEDNGGVGGWEYKRTPAGYDKNYKADFLITKADVAKIRGGKIDEQTLGKLKQDLESSEYLGYEYKKTHKNNGADEYADEEFFKGAPVESKGGHSAAAAIEEQRFAGTGRDKNTIMYVNPHVGAGLAGGTLNAKDENGNFDAEKFAKGFIYGLFGSKVTATTLKKTNPKLYDQIVNIGKDKADKEKISSFVNKLKQDELGKLLQKTITNNDLSTKTKIEIIEAAKKRFAKETPKSTSGQSEAQMIVKDKDQKEKRGIYNVVYNDKKSTIIYKDLEAIENAIKFEKGFENKVTKKGFGALHIEKHLNEKNAGWVTQQEYLNMGEVVRKGKLNTDKYGRRSYEYYKNGIRFRVAIGYTGKGKDRVISFFSDRKPKK